MSEYRWMALAAFLCLPICGSASDIAVPNGGFDNVAVGNSNWQYVKDQSGGYWEATKNTGDPWVCNNDYAPGADGGAPADSGVQKVEMNAGYVHQWLTNKFVAGVSYTLTCQASAKNRADQGVYLYLFNSDGTLGVDSNYQARQYSALSQDNDWHGVSVTYTATANDDGKQIGIQIYGRSDTYVDTVRLTLHQSQPEPVYDEPAQDLTAAFEQASDFILAQSGISNRSYCCVFGARRGGLMRELAERSRLYLIGVEGKTNNVAAARAGLRAAGLYGSRCMVHEGSVAEVPYSDYCAALVVSDAIMAYGHVVGSAAEMYRMIRPDGGVAVIGQPPGVSNVLSRAELENWLDSGGVTNRTIIENAADGLWAVIRRGPLEGAGKWTQLWADPGNRGCSGDTRIAGNYSVLWFGEPGPRVLIDRHNRPQASLYDTGCLVIPGNGRIVCVDAYNGARLWDVAVPGASRVAVLRDCGWLVMDATNVFAAVSNRCLKINLADGRAAGEWTTPTAGRDWGYLSVGGSRVFGSEQIKGASFIGPVGYNSNGEVMIAYGGYKPVITSRAIFCRNRDSGSLLWRYAGNSVILNPSICRDENSIYFYESTNAAAMSDVDGRVLMSDFASPGTVFLVKLDAADGSVVWRKSKDIPFEHIVHLSYSDGVLLGSGSSGGTVSYNLRAYLAGDGSDLWSRDIPQSFAANRSHGEQDKHPMIIGDKIVLKYGSYDLHNGNDLNFTFGTAGCADCSSSAKRVFARVAGNPGDINLANGNSGRLSTVIRPGCYISIIPAGGIVMLPAYSSGCTCDYPVQTTVTWKAE